MTRSPWPFPTAEAHPQPQPTSPNAPSQPTVQVQHVAESTLDQGVEESFPASDPVSVVSTKVVESEPKPESGARPQ